MDTISGLLLDNGSVTNLQPQKSHCVLQKKWLFYKRSFDIVCSLVIILFLAVPLLMIIIAIRTESPGSALFRQKRRGRGGELFHCYKFRSMHAHMEDADASQQTRRDDPRVTRVGGVLRRASLDELPQIFNVLIGDMSLIGPRPHAPGTNIDGRLLPDIAADYSLRYVVKPGITGWAQVHGCRGILDTEQKLRDRLDYDFFYIDHWSPLLDLRIMFRTLKCMFDEQAF